MPPARCPEQKCKGLCDKGEAEFRCQRPRPAVSGFTECRLSFLTPCQLESWDAAAQSSTMSRPIANGSVGTQLLVHFRGSKALGHALPTLLESSAALGRRWSGPPCTSGAAQVTPAPKEKSRQEDLNFQPFFEAKYHPAFPKRTGLLASPAPIQTIQPQSWHTADPGDNTTVTLDSAPSV